MKDTIFWFRNDLRLSDNPGLAAAAANGSVMPIYILDDINAGSHKLGAASRWWLHGSLNQLNKSLNGNLNLYKGDAKQIISELLAKNPNIKSVYWNRCYEPWRMNLDAQIKNELKNDGIDCKSFNGSLLWEPWSVLKSDGEPYKVFTPFYRKGCLQNAELPRKPITTPQNLTFIKDKANTCTIDQLDLLPQIPWHEKIQGLWQTGEVGAFQALTQFLNSGLDGYKEGRNFPDQKNVSRLSPYLRFGEISPHQVWYAAETAGLAKGLSKDLDHFMSELGWREFSYYLLYHFPELSHKNFQEKFDRFPWQEAPDLLHLWQKGLTGYPIVDAGMRELWQTGYMHNRVRMIVASFLVKNLLIHWHHGERWFWDCLVDADAANNSASWQWVAGSGADAAPYFRIFNPVLQGEKFDPEGRYTRRFVPELAKLPDKFLFKPWEAPETVLKQAGITLGEHYPKPIVAADSSREKALQAYKSISGNS